MYTKLKQTCSKLLLYLLVVVMFTLAIWFNIHSVESVDQSFTPLADSPNTINISDTSSESAANEVNTDTNGILEENVDATEIPEENIDELEIHETIADNTEFQTESDLLSGPALYLSYVDQITTEIYPDIPADYVKAIIWRESTYNPNCKTGDNVGLMQVSLKWDTDRARSLGVNDLYDPYGNILVGCDILNEFMQTYSFEYAINYHAGGYVYADAYKNSTSPVEKELARIIERMSNGDIVIGGE